MNAKDKQVAERLAKDFLNGRQYVRELSPIDAGGSGFIFKMILEDNTSRALKIFRPDQIDQPTLLDGFQKEGERLCETRHPRIVQGYEAGIQQFPSTETSLPYFVMEFVPHDSLEKVLSRNQLPPKFPILLNLLRQTLEALQYIHSLTPPLVHLDVKEGNLLVDMTSPETPFIKLSDFGVSKLVSREERTTEVRGTLFYWPSDWQAKLKERIPSNVHRATIRLPRNEIPAEVDLHMLSVTFQRVLDRLFEGQEGSYWHRSLSLLLERMNWDLQHRSTKGEKYKTAERVLVGLQTLERAPSLPPPLEEKGSLRVPVHPLHSYGEAVRAVLDCPWVQRLRRVRQLGVAHLVYPGATHSRFEHTIGAYSHTLLYLRALLENGNSPWFAINFGPRETKALAFTALVHDIGHYPFAHQLEDVEDWPRHEVLSYEILTGSILSKYPDLEKVFGDPGVILKVAERDWGLDRELIVRMLSYCYRSDLPELGVPKDVPRAWRAAAQLVNGPIDADKLDYIRRDSHHCGVSYGLLSDPSRFLSSLTVAFDDAGTHLAVTEKGRVDAEFIPVIRYAMFSEVYWHHTVRSFTTMLRRALQLAAKWQAGALTVENLLRWSDDRLLREVKGMAEKRGDGAVEDLVTLVMDRKPYVRLYTLVRERNPPLYEALTSDRLLFMAGRTREADAAMIEEVFGIRGLEPHHLLWDIPKPGKDKLGDLRIADLHGDVLAQDPGPLWKSLSENFEQWVRKIRLFIHPKHRPRRHSPSEEIKQTRDISARLGARLGI